MLLINRISDTDIRPVIGDITDKTKITWEKFHPYLFGLAIPLGIMGVLSFTSPHFSMNGKNVYAYITFALMMMANIAMNLPLKNSMDFENKLKGGGRT